MTHPAAEYKKTNTQSPNNSKWARDTQDRVTIPIMCNAGAELAAIKEMLNNQLPAAEPDNSEEKSMAKEHVTRSVKEELDQFELRLDNHMSNQRQELQRFFSDTRNEFRQDMRDFRAANTQLIYYVIGAAAAGFVWLWQSGITPWTVG